MQDRERIKTEIERILGGEIYMKRIKAGKSVIKALIHRISFNIDNPDYVRKEK